MKSILCVATIFVALFCCNSSAAKQDDDLIFHIQGQKIEDSLDGVVQMRRFLSPNANQVDRCTRLAVLLNELRLRGQQEQPLNTMQVAGIALANGDRIRKQFSSIDFNTLRKLYIEAIENFRAEEQIDLNFMELVTCLETKFKRFDARARTYLNNPELKQLIEQYNSILSQPIELLVNENVRHPTLKLEQVSPAIVKSLSLVFGGDEVRASKMFESNNSVGEPTATENSEESQQEESGAKVADSHFEQPKPDAEQAKEEQQVAAGSGQVVASAQATAMATPEVGNEDGELVYLENIVKALNQAYESVAIESKLADRCELYGDIVGAKMEELSNSEFVKQKVDQIGKRIAQNGAGSLAYVPSKENRDDFLVIVSAIDPEQANQTGVWIDMVDCVSQWQAVDKEAAEFMNNPESQRLFELATQVQELPAAQTSVRATPAVASKITAAPEKKA